MRRLVPWLGAVAVLVALWPAVCMSSEGGPTTCHSIAFLSLPWGASADTWGMLVAVVVTLTIYVVLRALLRGPREDRSP